MIPIFIPKLNKKAKEYVIKCIETNWVSSQGAYIRKFENALAKYHNIKYCIVTSGCTSALHLSLKSLKLKKNDEVICPDLTFIAPANMIVLSGAKLKLVDVDPETFNIDHKQIEKNINKNTKAIMVVHQFGHSADMDPIMRIARKYKLKVIEDNAESIGGKYKGKKLGAIGDLATLSFYANKIIKKILKIRKNQMLMYEKYLSQINQIKIRSFKKWCSPVHWMTTITINKKGLRNKLIHYLSKEGVDARPMVNPVHEALHFKRIFNRKNFINSINISRNSMHLPSSTQLKPKQIKFICGKVKLFFNKKH